ncbi:MAG: serine/threonine-protein kinase, partial [Planctomycetota bacterium]|nr:serine/threonine-protein kinase [Planctomycetota bacterium]
MSFPTIDLFLKRLEDSKLLNDEQLRSIRSTAQTFEVEFASEYAAKTLIRDGILTHWQAQVLLSKGGNFFLGNHKLLELIGRGGMGTVYKAEHTVLGRIVAIKVMSRELMANKNLVARFHKEIQAGATLDNPHVVRSIDASVIGKTHFLVMEYIDGHDLWSVMAKRKKLPPGEACEYIRQAAVGLQHAHEVGMVHRDIKPSNLIRTWDKDRPLVKIFDMGLARIVSEQTVNDEMTRTGQIMGTPEYMSPEQGWDTKKVDVRGDIYSLGCTLFRLLTGRVPFQGENPLQTLMVRCTQDAPPLRKYASELSAELEEVLGKMLAKEPSRRYQTPGEVAVALTAFAVVPTRAEVEALELAADDAPPELSDADISHEEHGFEDFIHDLKELEDHPEPTVPVAKAVLVADVVEPILPIQSVRSTTRRKSKSNNTVIASVATVGVLLVGALVWAISGNGNSTAAKNSADDSGNMITFEALPATSVDEQTMLAVQVRPVEQPSSSDGFRFSLGPSAPLGMSVDPKTGRLMWTPQEEHGPGSFHVDVECVDVANPTRKGTAQVNIQVNEVDLPLRVQPISPIKANVGETVVLDIQATDPDIPVQPIHFDMAPGSPPGSRIHPQSGRFQWTVPNGMPPGEHTIAVLVDQMATRAPTSIVFEFRIVVGDQPTSLPGESFVAEIADREIEQGKQLIVPIGFTRPVPGKKVSIQTNFGKARTAAIDEKTGKIVWTPTNSDAPGEYVFKLRFMVDNNPDLIDEKSFTVKVTSATPTPPKKDAPKTPVAKVDSRKPIPPEPDRKAAEQTLREVMEREF